MYWIFSVLSYVIQVARCLWVPCVEAFVSVYHECSADVSLKTLLECECVPARENICGLVNFKSLSVKSGSRVAFASFHRVLTIVFGFSLAWRKHISISLDLEFST